MQLLIALVICMATCGAAAMRSVDPCPEPAEPHKKLADGCRHVYVDMGTNIGHQIRKVRQHNTGWAAGVYLSEY